MSRADEIVHCNVSVAKFKALVKSMTEVRYVVDSENKLHVGAAKQFIHSCIKREAQCNTEHSLIHGYARYANNEIQHFIYYVYDNNGHYVDSDKVVRNWTHPKLTEIEARGVSRSYEKFDFVG